MATSDSEVTSAATQGSRFNIFDIRVIGVVLQVVFVIATIVVFAWFARNTAANVQDLGEAQYRCLDGSSSFLCSFDFLRSDAQFDISEQSIEYSPDNSYWRALGVGAVNSLKVIALGVILTTFVGLFVGIMRLSNNWLVSNIAKWYVDLLRNTPLVLQLIFLFFVFFSFFLPKHTEAEPLFGLPIFMSNRGINYPSPTFMSGSSLFLIFIIIAILAWVLLNFVFTRREFETRKSVMRWPWLIGAFLLLLVAGWFFSSGSQSSQGFMVAEELGIDSFDDVTNMMQERFGDIALADVEAQLAAGTLSEEEYDANLITVCVIDDTRAGINISERLKAANIPHKIDGQSRPDRGTSAFADGDCELFAADLNRLTVEKDLLESSGAKTIMDLAQPPLAFTPAPMLMSGASMVLLALGLAIALIVALNFIFNWQESQMGTVVNRKFWYVVTILVFGLIGWYAGSRGASDHAIMSPAKLRIRQFDDINKLMIQRFGVNGIGQIATGLADGTFTQAEYDENSLSVCAVSGSRAGANFARQLDSSNLPYKLMEMGTIAAATTSYVDEQCDVLVAPMSELTAHLETDGSSGAKIVTLAEPPIVISSPKLQGLNFVGGGKITPAFGAVLIGLVLNTAASIAEIVRAGIQAVSKGQSEAARALGLSDSQRLRLVVLPQALQVIIPPQISQYLNLAKNSTLALAVSYPDLWNVANTTINQSGRALQIMLLIMVSYLSLSLLISAVLNWYNQQITIKER